MKLVELMLFATLLIIRQYVPAREALWDHHSYNALKSNKNQLHVLNACQKKIVQMTKLVLMKNALTLA